MKTLVKMLFLESSLELVPRELHREPDVIRSARRYEIPPTRLILDKSLHYKAMRGLEKKWKRGRPDIIHICLLLATDTPLTRMGVLEVYFHVLDGRVFKVRSDTRLPRHLERFKWEKGEPRRPEEVVEEAIEENAIIGIGAFPRGDFEETTLRLAYKKYAIAGGHPLAAWSVTSRLLCELERRLGI